MSNEEFKDTLTKFDQSFEFNTLESDLENVESKTSSEYSVHFKSFFFKAYCIKANVLNIRFPCRELIKP